jgi:hypothetical protein
MELVEMNATARVWECGDGIKRMTLLSRKTGGFIQEEGRRREKGQKERNGK